MSKNDSGQYELGGLHEVRLQLKRLKEKNNKRKTYCLRLSDGSYIASCQQGDIMSVADKEYADIFHSLDEADEYKSVNWVDADIVEI